MLKFSNEDYSIPRERMGFQRGINSKTVPSNDIAKFRCDGSRNTDYYGKCGLDMPMSCGNKAALASVYSPYQEYRELFDCMTALCNGTLFMELHKPLKGGMCNG